jgi:GTP cyclohydrolase I
MVDVAKQNDHRGVSLDEVGVSDLLLPIWVLERESHKDQHTIGTFDVSVSLADNIKGTHMSRITEAIYAYAGSISQQQLMNMAIGLLQKLESSACRIRVRFPYAVKRLSPVSHLENQMVYPSYFEVIWNSDVTFHLGVDVDVMTVCPCAKEECGNGNSHVQRGTISISVQPRPGKWIWLEELIEIAEACGSSPVYDRLKRPDEKQVVLDGFNNPKFVEDIVRDVVVALEKRIDIESYRVSCKNYESIHRSNCYAVKEVNWK